MSSVKVFMFLILSGINFNANMRAAGGYSLTNRPKLTNAILESMKAGLWFMEEHVESVNLDALIGVRMVYDQLFRVRDVIKQINTNQTYDETLEKIARMIEQCRSIIDSAIPHDSVNEPKYFEKIGNLLQTSWIFNDTPRSIDESLFMKPTKPMRRINEKQSDNCIGLLINEPKCRISKKCWDMMTFPGAILYMLTHQLFYFLIAIMNDCLPDSPNSYPGMKIDEFCANIYTEYEHIDKKLNFQLEYQDIFMEQAAFCGMVGYKNFFKYRYIQKILSWQNKKLGCWFDDKSDDEEDQVTISNQREQEDRGGRSKRVKREEKMIGDACLCHKSTVALAALVQFLKHGFY
ncbi:hypothetical protein HELRODRAFT_184982 [Helobdella robusta]|uniref:Uncharacterized protein n=1 Tax=Helobdella robusta TaxID=6412 RepID=T1FM81_HELRO|nr:hypothetical protein HELRODRAFT_184982 [Helobdella robusta]ESO02271.1 hypothetical protein HELRODRAFT_184982 [Helobdella robusta]